MRINALLLVVASTLAVQNYACADPSLRSVPLQTYTKLSVVVPPGLGVKFTFPFVLNDVQRDKTPPFTAMITHEMFQYQRFNDVNSVEVYLPPDAILGQRGILFMNAAGYEISVELLSSNDRSQYVSDVRFEVSGEKRENLIDEEVAMRLRPREEALRREAAEVQKNAEKIALKMVGDLVGTRQSTSRIKQKQSVDLKNGDRVTVYVDSQTDIGRYSVLLIETEVKSRTAGVSVRGARLFAVKKDGTSRIIDAGVALPKRIEAGNTEDGKITYFTNQLTDEDQRRLVVMVEDTTVEVTW